MASGGKTPEPLRSISVCEIEAAVMKSRRKASVRQQSLIRDQYWCAIPGTLDEE
jgi:hypothetical protein